MVQISSSVPFSNPTPIGPVGEGPALRRPADQESDRPVTEVAEAESERRDESKTIEAERNREQRNDEDARAAQRAERAEDERPPREGLGREVDILV